MRIYRMSEAAMKQRAAVAKKAAAARWGEKKRGRGRLIRVDGDVAAKLQTIDVRFRREVASNILRVGLGIADGDLEKGLKK